MAIDLEDFLPATFTAPELSEEQFLAVGDLFPTSSIEYTEEGEVIVSPCKGPIEAARGARAVHRLGNWAEEAARGHVCGPDASFLLPSRARRSPDASWFEGHPTAGARFAVFAPQFVIEVRSPHDRISQLRDKMQRYIAAGVLLAWLIDPMEQTVTIYRPDREPEVLESCLGSRRGAG